jgi:hypothetical protein
MCKYSFVTHDHPKERCIPVLTAYCDESGIHDDDWCVVAGFIGTDEQWKRLAVEWKAALGKKRSLHMRDLRWAKPQRFENLLFALGPIPGKCGLQRIWGGIRRRDYVALFDTERQNDDVIQPYMMAQAYCMCRVMANVSQNETVHLVFSRQDVYSALTLYPETLSQLITPERVIITYLPEGHTLLTEPADYLAFAVRHYKIDSQSVKSKACRSILGDLSGWGALPEKKDIIEMYQNTVETVKKINDNQLKPRESKLADFVGRMLAVPHEEIHRRVENEKTRRRAKRVSSSHDSNGFN